MRQKLHETHFLKLLLALPLLGAAFLWSWQPIVPILAGAYAAFGFLLALCLRGKTPAAHWRAAWLAPFLWTPIVLVAFVRIGCSGPEGCGMMDGGFGLVLALPFVAEAGLAVGGAFVALAWILHRAARAAGLIAP